MHMGDFMSIFNCNERIDNNDRLENDVLHLALMKKMAEQNHDKFLEYDRETDTVILSEVQDGSFQCLEMVEGYISKQDMVLSRIYETDQEVYRREIQICLSCPKHSVFEIRYMDPEFGPRWYRIFLMSVADEHGYVTKFVARLSDIQEYKKIQENVEEISALTENNKFKVSVDEGSNEGSISFLYAILTLSLR